MPYFIQRLGSDGKPQYLRNEAGVLLWTTDPEKMSAWNSQDKCNNIIASQTETEGVGDPGASGYIPPVAGFIKRTDNAVVRERPDHPTG